MRLPQVNYASQAQKKQLGTFGGYNHQLVINDNEFYDMQNMSSDYYPAAGPRKDRGEVVASLIRPNGIFYKNALAYVDGTDFYYDGEIKGQVEDSRKHFCGMGAYILIWPDKAYYNTSTGEFGSLVKKWKQSGFAVTFTEVSENSAYTQIAADGITDFSQYDSVTIEGCDIDDFNKTTVIQDVQDGYIVITGVLNKYDNVAASWKSYYDTTIAPYSGDTSWTKITSEDLGTTVFALGDQVTISGCNDTALNNQCKIVAIGSGYIVVNLKVTSTSVQTDGMTIKRVNRYTQTKGLSITREVPDMDFICESNNRIWGCSSENHEIYSCKLGDPFNWNNFEGISTDSYAVTVGSDGDFTGCIAHLGNVIFFKENTIHKLFGTKPSNYQINSYELPGVLAGCSDSICIIDETLYYKGREGVYTYDGSTPTMISDAFGDETYTDASASRYREKYYISMMQDEKSVLMVWDPKRRMWHKENSDRMSMACCGAGDLYFVNAQNEIQLIASDSTDSELQWELESGPLIENTLDHKYVSKLQFHLELERGSRVEIFMRYDDDPLWERKASVICTRKRSYLVPIIPKRCQQYRYKIVGYGKGILYGISKYVEEGSEV
jgi:hypothetical protein